MSPKPNLLSKQEPPRKPSLPPRNEENQGEEEYLRPPQGWNLEQAKKLHAEWERNRMKK